MNGYKHFFKFPLNVLQFRFAVKMCYKPRCLPIHTSLPMFLEGESMKAALQTVNFQGLELREPPFRCVRDKALDFLGS